MKRSINENSRDWKDAQFLFDRNVEYMNEAAPKWNAAYRNVEHNVRIHEQILKYRTGKKIFRSPDIEVAQNSSPDNIAETATKTGTL